MNKYKKYFKKGLKCLKCGFTTFRDKYRDEKSFICEDCKRGLK